MLAATTLVYTYVSIGMGALDVGALGGAIRVGVPQKVRPKLGLQFGTDINGRVIGDLWAEYGTLPVHRGHSLSVPIWIPTIVVASLTAWLWWRDRHSLVR